MIHVRAVSPVDLTDRVEELLARDPYVLNLIVQRGAVRNPDGDSVACDVLTGAANEVLRGLRELQVDLRGSLVIEPVDMAFSGRASESATRGLGALANAPVWDQVEARIRSEGRYAPSFYFYLVIAGLIGSVGIVTNSQILIVAAMVVGPEYGAIVAVALGIDRRNRAMVRTGLSALCGGLLLTIAVTLLFSLLIRAFGLQSDAFDLGLRPVSDLINTPNFFSFAVAALAGVVGIVSLTEARTSALLGVFISVTTIPAAAAISVSTAFASWSEARGSLIQLLVNITVLIVVGAAALRCQRAIWRRVGRTRDGGRG
ncbi:putative hydrophobic protein (TIGR00271 family) [Streptomyces sp. B1I3]|nr:putative hydrophobic protein (TIGR00271 family) [Streptomyces sp. B1I3]